MFMTWKRRQIAASIGNRVLEKYLDLTGKNDTKYEPELLVSSFNIVLVKRPMHRWEDNIKINLREVRWERHELDRFGSRHGQAAGSCECGNEPPGSIKCGEFLE